jgi:hypothetical protein
MYKSLGCLKLSGIESSVKSLRSVNVLIQQGTLPFVQDATLGQGFHMQPEIHVCSLPEPPI